MCGIIGQIITGDNHLDAIPNFPDVKLLAHRGPDGHGEWTNENRTAYLGHTRLAILDPTPVGAQPMTDSTGRYWLTFNGEIYNHLALRQLIPSKQWRSTSDTETLLELLIDKGPQALSLLKGMFAFGFYDTLTGTLLLARDRFGIKPLWIFQNEQKLCFASELRPLLPCVEPSLAEDAFGEYIAFGRMPDSTPGIDGICSIPPGSWLEINHSGHKTTGTWWPVTTTFHPTSTVKNRLDAAQQVQTLITQAVEEHLLSDVGVGAFLSGGIDSSIITMIAGRTLGKQLKTFTVGFPNGHFDERSIARQVATAAGSDHHEIEVDEHTCLDWVKEAVMVLDVPSVDAINTYIVSKAVRQTGIKVALSGLGGDELFGGYQSFSHVPLLSSLRYLPSGLRNALIKQTPAAYQEKLAGLPDPTIVNLTVARRRFVSTTKLRGHGLTDGLPKIADTPTGLDTMGQISWGEIQGYMIPMLLRDSDQMSMAVALEIRVPFLDHQVVETVLAMPQRYKRGKGVKPLLVEAFRNQLPTAVYDRPKQGFALPMDAWIRGPLSSFTEEGTAMAADLFKLSAPTESWLAFQRQEIHWTRLWTWSVLGHWYNRHMAVIEA